MSLNAFYKANRRNPENCKVAVSENFVDEKGKPILWEIRRISERENTEIRNSCITTKIVKRRKEETCDTNRYLRKMCAACVVFPDLKDADLQKDYSVMGAEELLVELLAPGEFGNLLSAVQEINGYDQEAFDEEVEEVKNS